ncbi:MAG: cation:proton antiporter subunit C [Planctomycetota bacterium]|jgi:multicomponent Na+:H+ antiporter subunit C
MMDVIVAKYNYWIYILLMMIGFYTMIAKKNLVKKIIGMNIFQTAIILFYVSTGAKQGASIPIIEHGHEADHGGTVEHVIDTAAYVNPLPHVLMLTAIVVSVATLGVALALAVKLYRQYGTLEEDEILEKIQ